MSSQDQRWSEAVQAAVQVGKALGATADPSNLMTIGDRPRFLAQLAQKPWSVPYYPHDALDRAVFDAYGWNDLADVLVGRPGATTPLPDKPPEQAEAEEELLTRLVALNAERAAEEAQGHIRWLRPDFQAPDAEQTTADLAPEEAAAAAPTTESEAKQPWPKTMPEQVQAVRAQLAVAPQTAESLAARFKRRPLKSVTQVLAALEVLGQAKCDGEQWILQRSI